MGDSGTRVDAPATPDTCLFPVGGAREEERRRRRRKEKTCGEEKMRIKFEGQTVAPQKKNTPKRDEKGQFH
jgi:hypothetical protein